MQRIFQAVAWLLAGIIVVLSLSPASVRPTTGAQHDLEHLSGDRDGIWFRLSRSISASDNNCAANIRGCDRGCANLGSWSPCEDERFLGRCGGLVRWSWIIVCVRKAKSGGYPKVTAGNRLAKHGSPSAAPLVGRPPESLRFEIDRGRFVPTRCSGRKSGTADRRRTRSRLPSAEPLRASSP